MTKIEVISQKPSKNWIFGKNDLFFTLLGPENPPFWIFPRIPLLTHARRHSEEDFRKFSAKTNDKNWSYKTKTFKKLDFWQKWPFFDSFWPKKSLILNFPTDNHYSHTLEDTQKKTLGSFQPKLMTKIEVIRQKPWIKLGFWQNWPFFW